MLVCLPFGIGHFIVYATSWVLLMGFHIFTMVNGYNDGIGYFRLFMCSILSITIVSGIIFFIYSCGKKMSGQFVGYTGILIGSVTGVIGTTSFYSVSNFTIPNCMLIIGLYCGSVALNTGLYIWLWCIRFYKNEDKKIVPKPDSERVTTPEVEPPVLIFSSTVSSEEESRV